MVDMFTFYFFSDKAIMSLPIPAKGPKVTSLIWNGLDDLIVTGHDNGDIVQVTNSIVYLIALRTNRVAVPNIQQNKICYTFFLFSVGRQNPSKSKNFK